MYKIKCKDRDCVYVGQTSRALKTVKENAKTIIASSRNSVILAQRDKRHVKKLKVRREEALYLFFFRAPSVALHPTN